VVAHPHHLPRVRHPTRQALLVHPTSVSRPAPSAPSGRALGYELRTDGFGGWAKVLVPPDGNRFCIVDLSHDHG
jgi:hypothetical protein